MQTRAFRPLKLPAHIIRQLSELALDGQHQKYAVRYIYVRVRGYRCQCKLVLSGLLALGQLYLLHWLWPKPDDLLASWGHMAFWGLTIICWIDLFFVPLNLGRLQYAIARMKRILLAKLSTSQCRQVMDACDSAERAILWQFLSYKRWPGAAPP